MRKGIAASARLEALRRLDLLPPVRDSELDEITALAALACDAPMSAIALVGDESVWFASQYGAVPDVTESVSDMFAAPVEEAELVVVPKHDSPGAFVGLPLVTSRGYALGTLAVMDDKPRELSARELSALRLLARRAVRVMEQREFAPESARPASDPFEQAPFSYVLLDAKGCIERVNAMALRMLGYTREELVCEHRFTALLTPEAAERCERELRAAPVTAKSIEFECEVIRKDTTRVSVLLAASITRTGGGPSIVRAAMIGAGGRNDSLERSVEPERAANSRLVAILESTFDGFVALDADWRYTYVNRRAGEMFGRAPADLVGKVIWEEFPDGVDQPFYRAYVKAFTEQVPLQIEQHYEPWDRWFENRIFPFEGGVVIFFTEISERKRAEAALRATAERLRSLSARLETVREEESSRIAQLLHDDFGQALTVLKMDIAWLGRRARAQEPPDDAVLKRLTELDKTVDGSIATVRSVAAQLRPPIDGARLCAAMESRARDVAERASIELVADLPTQPVAVTREGAVALYRIAQEALTNVVRHACAKRVTIAMRFERDDVVLEIRDDGVGIEASRVSSSGMGVMGMVERAQSVGGELIVTRAAGRGTVVEARVPRVDGR